MMCKSCIELLSAFLIQSNLNLLPAKSLPPSFANTWPQDLPFILVRILKIAMEIIGIPLLRIYF